MEIGWLANFHPHFRHMNGGKGEDSPTAAPMSSCLKTFLFNKIDDISIISSIIQH